MNSITASYSSTLRATSTRSSVICTEEFGSGSGSCRWSAVLMMWPPLTATTAPAGMGSTAIRPRPAIPLVTPLQAFGVIQVSATRRGYDGGPEGWSSNSRPVGDARTTIVCREGRSTPSLSSGQPRHVGVLEGDRRAEHAGADGYTNLSWLEHGAGGQGVRRGRPGRRGCGLRGRRWTGVAGVVPVPEVISVDLIRRAVLTVMPGRHGTGAHR
jgi:hypothetical protein